MDIILCFSYIFSFFLKGGRGLNSRMFIAVFLFIYAIRKPDFRRVAVKKLTSSKLKNLHALFIITMIWISIVLLVNGSTDFSFCKTFIHMYIIMALGIVLFSYYEFKGVEKKVVNYIIIAFITQSLIEWLGFLVPGVKEIIEFTKSEATLDRAYTYGGVRANALSGSDFFGLSTGFAMIYLLWQSDKNTLLKKYPYYRIILYLFLITGTFFAGRTGYIGLGLAVLYFIMNVLKVRKEKDIKIRKATPIISILVCNGIVLAGLMLRRLFSENDSFNRLFRFTFQALINKSQTGSYSTRSTDTLVNRMYFDIPIVTFFLGDGRYTNANGSYYMSTDAGYMRVILYMGIVGLLLLFSMQVSLMGIRKKHSLLDSFILLLILILNIKGETLFWSNIVLSMITLYYAQDKAGLDYSKFSRGEGVTINGKNNGSNVGLQ